MPPFQPLLRGARAFPFIACLSLAALGCESDIATGPAAVNDRSLTFGQPCTQSSACEHGACILVAEGRSVCSAGCAIGEANHCPAAPNWACLIPNDIEHGVCACQSDRDYEVCGDGLDNDCNGRVDDCLTCDGALVGPDDADHCGGCGLRCGEGATCVQGRCQCPAGTPEDACEQPKGGPHCTGHADCNDRIACTQDACIAGRCVSTVVHAWCDATEVCDLRAQGCVLGKACLTDRNCADDDPCTTQEQCDPIAHVCQWQPLDADGDGQPPAGCGGTDCDDTSNLTFAGAPELCDGIDNACNGAIDSPLHEDACGAEQLCINGDCECDAGFAKCGRACVDFDSDSMNCGGCGKRCDPGSTCQSGRCVCDAGTTSCRGACADLQTNSRHCGFCNLLCGPGTACTAGECVDTDECAMGSDDCDHARQDCVNVPGSFECVCKPGFTGPDCVDLDECAQAQTNHCAADACVNQPGTFACVCPAGFIGDGVTCADVDECQSEDCGEGGACVNTVGSFTCACRPGYRQDGVGGCILSNACQAGLQVPTRDWCDGRCSDLMTDPAHCGGCDQACPAGECRDGECACAVGSGLSYCTDMPGCVHLDSDSQHCGSCGTQCPTGGGCVGGRCQCPAGEADCGGVCTALQTTDNCMGCDDTCDVGAACTTSGCACPAGAPDSCRGDCVDGQSDSSACGADCVPCPSGAACNAGTCECPASVPDTCRNTCVDAQSDAAACGPSCAVCAAGATCSAGNCICPSGQTVCGDACEDTTTSPSHCGACGVVCDVLCSDSNCAVAVQVQTSRSTTCTLMNDGTVWCWGSDESGVFGNGGTSQTGPIPRRVSGIDDAVKIAMGDESACALSSNGELRCWGDNASNAYAPTSPGVNTAPILVATGVADMALGRLHTCLTLSTGAVTCIGSDGNGQQGDGPSSAPTDTWSTTVGLTDPDKLVAGAQHTCALKGGRVFCWGSNDQFQLGLSDRSSPGHVPAEVPELSGAQDIDASADKTCVVVSGQVKCWGGWIHLSGTGFDVTASPEAVGGIDNAISVHTALLHTCAVLATGTLTCWGNRAQGRLGDGQLSGGTGRTPITVDNPDMVGALSAGGVHTCGIDPLGRVFCWGDGDNTYANGSYQDRATNTEVTSWESAHE